MKYFLYYLLTGYALIGFYSLYSVSRGNYVVQKTPILNAINAVICFASFGVYLYLLNTM